LLLLKVIHFSFHARFHQFSPSQKPANFVIGTALLRARSASGIRNAPSVAGGNVSNLISIQKEEPFSEDDQEPHL
jgi:hypothetical protein